jgi:hypothetical protein
MLGAILPVKRPGTDLFLAGSVYRLRLHEIKRQKSAAGFEMETKNTIVIPTSEDFWQSANPRSDR